MKTVKIFTIVGAVVGVAALALIIYNQVKKSREESTQAQNAVLGMRAVDYPIDEVTE
ncbi:MAG: hypothetical protein M9916_00885 [Crocinitomicaceae bacterium]|nr:hypothetical protein [Crocinitomicaceae bacterium]